MDEEPVHLAINNRWGGLKAACGIGGINCDEYPKRISLTFGKPTCPKCRQWQRKWKKK